LALAARALGVDPALAVGVLSGALVALGLGRDYRRRQLKEREQATQLLSYKRRIRRLPGYELFVVHVSAAKPFGDPNTLPEDDPGEDGEGDR